MYCIVSIIYGVPLTEAVSNLIQEWAAPGSFPDIGAKGEELAEWLEAGGSDWTEDGHPVLAGEDLPWGFKTLYNGGTDYEVGYCGVKLGEFNECRSSMHINEEFLASLKPSLSQQLEAESLVAKLHPHLKEAAGPIGTYFIFSYS